MRTKTRTTGDIKPGMVIRSAGAFTGTPNHAFRQVATVKPGPWPNTRYITFTDGSGNWFHRTTDWQVATSKTARKVAIRRPGVSPLDVMARMFFAYAAA